MRLTWTSQAWASCAAKILTSNRRVSALYDYTLEETIRNRVIRAWHGLIMKILVLSYRVAASKVLDTVLSLTPITVNRLRALTHVDDLAWELASAATAASDPPAPSQGRTAFMNRCAEELHRTDATAENTWTEDLKLELESKIEELEAKVKRLEEAQEEVEQEAEVAVSSSSTMPVDAERWATTHLTVMRNWAGYPTPWACYRCGAEWCRVRVPPQGPRWPPPGSPGWV